MYSKNSGLNPNPTKYLKRMGQVMITKLLHTFVVFNYIKCGIRYGIDRESSLYTGDFPNGFYTTTFKLWTRIYDKLGYKLIDTEIWMGCTYDNLTYLRYVGIKRF